MAAITGTAVTPVTLTINGGTEQTYTDATNAGTLVTDTETFEFSPSKSANNIALIIKNGCGAAVTAKLLAGDMWAKGDSASV